jgi:hypothetical protein
MTEPASRAAGAETIAPDADPKINVKKAIWPTREAMSGALRAKRVALRRFVVDDLATSAGRPITGASIRLYRCDS